MSQTKKRVLSACLAVVLAFSMLGTVPLAAFASNVKSLATYEPVLVYDYVYGIFGGKYALMFKGVVYEGIYLGNPMKMTGYVVDVVRADGAVTLHTAPADLGDNIPGGKAAYASFDDSLYNDARYRLGTNFTVDYKRGFTDQRDDLLWVQDKATGKCGIKSFDGSDIVPCKYDRGNLFGIAGVEGTLCYATSNQGGKASVTFFGLNGEDQGTISRAIGNNGYVWVYAADQAGVVHVRFYDGTIDGQKDVYARLENGKYKELPNYVEAEDGPGDVRQYTVGGSDQVQQATEWDNANERYVTTRTFALANGKKVVQKTYEKRNYMTADFSITHEVAGSDGKPITLGGYTLAVDTDTKQTKTVANRPAFNEPLFNSVKHGNADIWWAKDKNGKWGAVNSSGEVRVPFKYAGYYDAVGTDSNYALVKLPSNGKWVFIDLTAELPEGWQRLRGAGALDTMKAIVGQGFGKSNVVVIATSEGFADALAASALAGANDAPILMTEPGKLSKQTAEEISRLGATKAYVCGGRFAVSDAVISQIKAQTACKTVTRVKGSTADDTSREIAKAVGGAASDTVIIATQLAYQDALSVSSYAYATKSPIILLDKKAKLSSANVAYLKGAGFKKAILVGGKFAVPVAVEGQLKSAGIAKTERLKGSTAYDTSKAIAEWAVKNGLRADAMGVACGQNYPDALAGAALCGKNRAVLLLADSVSSGQAVSFAKANKVNVDGGYVFGGKYAVPDAVLDKLRTATK